MQIKRRLRKWFSWLWKSFHTIAPLKESCPCQTAKHLSSSYMGYIFIFPMSMSFGDPKFSFRFSKSAHFVHACVIYSSAFYRLQSFSSVELCLVCFSPLKRAPAIYSLYFYSLQGSTSQRRLRVCVINDAPAATAIGNVSSRGALLIIQLKTLCCRLNIALSAFVSTRAIHYIHTHSICL